MCRTELYSECASSVECSSVLLADSDEETSRLRLNGLRSDQTRMGYEPCLATALIMAM